MGITVRLRYIPYEYMEPEGLGTGRGVSSYTLRLDGLILGRILPVRAPGSGLRL